MGLSVTNAYALNCAFENPTGGDLLLADDAFADVSGLLPAGMDFTFYGVSYGPGQPGGGIFVGSNGVITFGSGLTDFSESSLEFAATGPIMAAMWDDFNPAVGGAVKAEFQSAPDRLIITWDGVPEWFANGSNTFQATLYIDSDRYEFVYNGMTAVDGLIGLSPDLFSDSDLSANKVIKGVKIGGISERFAGGADSFDLDGRCLKGKPSSKRNGHTHLKPEIGSLRDNVSWFSCLYDVKN